jgi:Secretion system C-terminal sorting domain
LENIGDLPTLTGSSTSYAPLLVYPDPMKDVARLVLPEPLGASARIELLDVRGRVVRMLAGNGTRELLLDRGHLPSGLYLLRLTGPLGSARTVRLVME